MFHEPQLALMPVVKNILVVEDDPKIRDLVVGQLRELGHEVTAVATGVEALHLLSTNDTFDLLFTDIMLPEGLSGIELLQRAQRAFGGSLKVLLTSGHPREIYESSKAYSHEVPLLEKPYGGRDLAEAIANILNGERGETQARLSEPSA